MAARSWDLIVVGAGILGVWHAYWAARTGRHVMLVERNDWPRDASARNFGMIIPSGMDPGPWHERALGSVAAYVELARSLDFPTRRGMLYLAGKDAEATVLAEFARIAPDHGYTCQLVSPEELTRTYPAMRSELCRNALFFPDDLILDPSALLRAFIPWLSERFGIAYQPRSTVVSIEVEGGGCMARFGSGRSARASHVVLCPGNETSILYADLFARAGISFTKLQMMRTVPQRQVLPGGIATGWTIRRYGSFTLAPSHRKLRDDAVPEAIDRNGIHILMKQDADGAVTIGDSHQGPPDEAALGPHLDMAIDELILEEARRAVDLPSWEVSTRWAGWYPTHPTRSLLRERLDERIEVVVILGGKGMTCAPVVARETIEALG